MFPGSGLGTSSTLCVSVLNALYGLSGHRISTKALASKAIFVEREQLQWDGGIQDQYSAAYGGFRELTISRDRNVYVKELKFSAETIFELESSLVLFHTGQSRVSADVIASQNMVFNNQEASSKTKDAVDAMLWATERVDACVDMLLNDDVSGFLGVFVESWQKKKMLSPLITNNYIDELSSGVIEVGASGIKISGAGGGGVCVVVTPLQKRYKVLKFLYEYSNKFGGSILPFNVGRAGAKFKVI